MESGHSAEVLRDYFAVPGFERLHCFSKPCGAKNKGVGHLTLMQV